MKVRSSWAVAGSLAVGLVAAGVGVAVWWPDGSEGAHAGPYADGPSSPRLLVSPPGSMYMMAQLDGGLSVNEQHCITLGRNVIVAPHGSKVTPDGKHVSFPGYAPIRLGTYLVGGGGSIDPRSETMDADLREAIDRCRGNDPGVSVVQFWLSRD